MAGGEGTDRNRRALLGAIVVMVLVGMGAAPRLAVAQDPANAIRELGGSPDFRIRVSAALYLGRMHPVGAREALEHALADAHPSVRVAAASALGTLADRAAIGALTRRADAETSESVKAQLLASIDQLRRGTPADDSRRLGPDVRYVVRLGAMRNPTGVRGDELRRVLQDAARARARAIRGAAVVDADAVWIAQAARRKLPVVTLDGSLLELKESRVETLVQVQARVEFAMRREQTLKATLTGAATTFGSSPHLSEQGRRQLQDGAVDGAVQSAMRGADRGLFAAAL